jgi:uncharacterized phage protein gp47/JayE
MYENVTFDSIMEDMLARVPSNMDKREGSVIWDALAPAAIELQNAYIALDTVLNETFADTASLYYLVKRAAERGIMQKLATNAVLQGEFTPADLELSIGSRFSCDTLNYIVTEKVQDGIYKLTCETAGKEGNKYLGTLIPIDYIDGLETAELTEVLIPADDDEDVESLRERYFNTMTSQAFGGNISDYKETTVALDGVGGVKVTPVWNGGGTVKLTIINSEFGVPTDELVESVQNAIDPVGHSGEGVGLAPIGHVVTVVGVKGKTIDIVTNITYQTGWGWESAKSYILNAIDSYLKELSKVWDESEGLIIRISQLESKILTCEGVLDISGTTLNGVASNLALAADEIPVRGTVNGN